MALRRTELPKAFTVITTLMVGSDITSRCLFWMHFRSGASLGPITLIARALLTILQLLAPLQPGPAFLCFLKRFWDRNLSAPPGWNRWEAEGEPHIPFYSSGILQRLFLNTDLHSAGMAPSTPAPRNLWTIRAHLTAGGDRQIPIFPRASGLTGTY